MSLHLDCGSCVIRSWRAGDVDSLARIANDRAIWLNLRDRFPHPYTRTDAESWIRFASGKTPETAFAIDMGGDPVGGIGIELHGDVERCAAEKAHADYPSRRRWGGGRRIGYHRRNGVARTGRLVPAMPGRPFRRSRMSDTTRLPVPPRA